MAAWAPYLKTLHTEMADGMMDHLRNFQDVVDRAMRARMAEDIRTFLRLTPKKFDAYLRETAGAKVSPGKVTFSRCWWCQEYSRQKCSGCGARVYCSRSCQCLDWRRHKKECRDFQDHGSKELTIQIVTATGSRTLVCAEISYLRRCKVTTEADVGDTVKITSVLTVPQNNENLNNFISRYGTDT